MQLQANLKHVVTWLQERTPRGQAVRFIIFLALYFLGRYPGLLFVTTSIGQAMLAPLHERLSFFITHTCCFVLQVFYPDIHTSVNHTIFIAGKAPIQLFSGCTGLYQMIRLTFVLVFYPLPWRRKAILFPFSMGVLLFAASLHFLLLIPISYHFPEWYGFAHNWIALIIFYGFYFLCWVIWESKRRIGVMA